MSMVEKSIQDFTDAKECYQNLMRRCHPKEEKTYRELIDINEQILTSLKRTQGIFDSFDYKNLEANDECLGLF